MGKFLQKHFKSNGLVKTHLVNTFAEGKLGAPYRTSEIALNPFAGLKILRTNKFKGMSNTVRLAEPEYIPGYKVRG